jgi:hypothetical protein
MTAEYPLRPGDDAADVAQMLLDHAEAPEHIQWAPRPDTPGGGVFVVHDEAVAAEVARLRQEQRDAEAQRIADAQAAADERDAKADETGLTPAELGFPAAGGTDPGSAAEAERNAEVTSTEPATEADTDGDEEPAADDPETPEDESKMTTAQRRKARKSAPAAAEPSSEEGK